jgi:DnaJ-class molecular chaperone
MAARSDYYQILGLDEDAPVEAIKRAYRARARACHPDRHPDDPAAAERFKGVTEAYEVLSNPTLRQQYDLLRRHPLNAFGHLPTAATFGTAQRASSRTNLRLRLSFGQALRGGKATVQLPNGRTTCIRVPPGTRDGATVQLKGRSPDGSDTSTLHVTFHVAPSERFRREGNDLCLLETVSALEAVLGTTRELKDAYGREVTLDVPPGTQPGARLRVPGHGVATPHHTGDLVVEITIAVPRLSDEQRERIRAAAEKAGLL